MKRILLLSACIFGFAIASSAQHKGHYHHHWHKMPKHKHIAKHHHAKATCKVHHHHTKYCHGYEQVIVVPGRPVPPPRRVIITAPRPPKVIISAGVTIIGG